MACLGKMGYQHPMDMQGGGGGEQWEDMSFEALHEMPGHGQSFGGLDMFRGNHMNQGFGDPYGGGVQFGQGPGQGNRGLRVGNIEELGLCEAWRQVLVPPGIWQKELQKCVAHRVHPEDYTVTVQFLSDQHRSRLPEKCIRPILNIDPQYPKIRLGAGERPPSREEIEFYEAEKARLALVGMSMPPQAAVRMDEAEQTRTEQVDHYGIHANVLDALRNRSIPPALITGEYKQHFYSNLYGNKFYPQEDKGLRKDSAVVNSRGGGANMQEASTFDAQGPGSLNARMPNQQFTHVSGPQVTVKRRFIALDGNEKVQQPDGTWLDSDGQFTSVPAGAF